MKDYLDFLKRDEDVSPGVLWDCCKKKLQERKWKQTQLTDLTNKKKQEWKQERRVHKAYFT